MRRVLGLKREPIEVKYAKHPLSRKEEEYYTVCGAVLEAANGKTNAPSKETCACPEGQTPRLIIRK